VSPHLGNLRCPAAVQGMTFMPCSTPTRPRSQRSNPLDCLERSTLARFVLLIGVAVLTACVSPPNLQLDQPDAGENAAPIITSVSNAAAVELVEPGPVTIERGRGALAIRLRDADVTDTLNVRLYVDYNRPDPTPARAACRVAPGTTVQRTTTCDISGVCTAADIGAQRLLWIEVFDRELLEAGQPRFRAMPAGGASSKWVFMLQCQEMQ